jgi:hypothetical protein
VAVILALATFLVLAALAATFTDPGASPKPGDRSVIGWVLILACGGVGALAYIRAK